MKSKLIAAGLLAFAAAASAQVHVTGSTATSIGDTLGTQYDIFTFNDGSFAPGLGTVDVTSYSFLAGVNSNYILTTSGTVGFTLSAFGQSSQVDVPYTFLTGYVDDTISFGSVTKFYDIGGQEYEFKTNSFTLTNGGGAAATGELTATISAVPEPANVMLLLAGLVGLAGVARRRRVL